MKRDEVSKGNQNAGKIGQDAPEIAAGSAQVTDGSGNLADDPDAPLGGSDAPVSLDAANVPQPALRKDLRLVREGQTAEQDGKKLPGRVRIIDLRTDRQFDFTSQEHFLCVAADGVATHWDLRARLTELTTTPLSIEQVSKFFRRLQILGLLDTAAAPTETRGKPVRASGPTRFSDMREAAAKAASKPEGERAAPVLPRFKPRSVPETTLAPTVASPVEAPPDAAEQLSEPRAVDAEPTLAKPPKSKTPTAKLLTLRADAPKEAEQAAEVEPEPDPFDDPEADASLFGPGISFGKEGEFDDPWETEPAIDRPRFRRGMGGGMGGMGGGLGGGMGGLGGGMGGLGGGMGPGMGGGMGPGMMGGMMGGGMMGGMMGMRGAGQAPPAPVAKGPAQLSLFNPHSLLRAIYVIGWPLKFLFLALIPLVLFAGLTMIHRFPQLTTDFIALVNGFGVVTKLLMGLLLVNLTSRLAQGVAIVAHGGRVNDLGINLVLGFMPRTYIDTSAIETLPRKGQLWAHGGPLLFRLFIFSAGILVWAITREQGGTLPELALVIAKFGLLMFVMTAIPILPTDGMRFLAAFFNEPKLMLKSVMAFKHTMMKGRLPPMLSPGEIWPLTLFAIAMLLSLVLMLGTVAIYALILLEGSLGGTGVIIFLCLMTISTLWFMAMFQTNKSRAGKFGGMAAAGAMPGMRPAMPEPGAAPFKRPGPAPAGAPGQGRTGPMRPRPQPAADALADDDAEVDRLPNRARVIWAILLIGGLIVAFLPYGYETGGQVAILPAERGYSVARTDGEIAEVFVRQGQFVTKGTVLAKLSDWDQTATIAVSESKLAVSLAQLAAMEAGAQPEQIEVERAQVARAEASLVFKRLEVERSRELLTTSTVSQASLDKAEAEYAAAVADLAVARANLVLVEIGATEEDLAILRAEVARQEQELSLARDELERTQIIAPIDGKIITADIHLRLGDYLRRGDPFTEIERDETVTATIAVPESDIGLIKPGQTVRMRVRSESNIEVLGTVKQISPVAEESGYGLIVRATAEFPNTSGEMRSEMSGYAKIDGVEMRVWEAYLRGIVRFFQIDVWSWIP